MARVKSRVGPTQRWLGYAILGLLGLILAWLLVQQSRFNPAVLVAARAPHLQSRSPAGPVQALSATAALFPEVSGFSPLTPVQSYGPDNLSDKIDGKAELYLQAGFKEMSCRSFGLAETGGARVEVFLYDMGAPPNAFAVFSGQRRPGSPSLPLSANAYATANALYFTKGGFYVEIVADRAAEALQPALEAYARALLAKLPGEGEAKDAAALFPKEGLALDTVRLSPTDAFGLEGFNNVLTGEYNLKSGKATAFIAERENPEQARAEAQRYQEFLTANGYREITKSGAAEDVSLLSLDNSYELFFVEGRRLAGVHDASSSEGALELAAKLATALKGQP